MTDAATLQAIATLVPDLAIAATLTMFIVAAVRAWLPTRVGSYAISLDGGRVIPVVYVAALAVVALLVPEFELTRAWFASSLAVSVFAVAEYTSLQFLRSGPSGPQT